LLNLITIFLLGQLDHFGFATISSPKIAGDTFSITIYAFDAVNDIYPYNGPAFVFTSLGPEFGNTSAIFNNGVWQGDFVATLADTYSIRCQDYANPIHTGESNQIIFEPNDPYRLLTILPGQTYYPGIDSGKIGNATPQQAGASFNVSIYLTDRWCNKISSADDAVQFLTTDQFKIPSNLVLYTGSLTFSYAFRSAQNHRCYLNDLTNPGIKSDTSSGINIYPGAYSELLVILPGETYLPGDTTRFDINTPGKSGVSNDQYVLENFSVLVYATDSMWNKTSTSGNLVTLRSDFPPLNNSPLTLNLINGERQFTVNFSQAGDNQNLWAENDVIYSYINYLDIIAKTMNINIIVDPDTITAGQSALITATIYDRSGQPIEGKYIAFTVLSGHGYIFNADNQTDSSGIATAYFGSKSTYFNELNTIGVTADDTTFSATCYVFVPDTSIMAGKIVAYPNPMGIENQTIQFIYYLPSSCNLIFAIYDPFGNLVHREDKTSGDVGTQQGVNILSWNGRNDKGRKVASGVYYAVIKGYTHTARTFEDKIRIGVVW